ncbi:MAG: flagellar biosynthesis anti-sigma factor FlgM [Planctomycetota bacterium]
MQISGVGGGTPVGPGTRVGGGAATGDVTPTAANGPAFAPQDSLQISDEALALSRPDGASTTPRAELVARIKAEIEAGTYDTADKLEAAVGRMLDDLG